MTELTKEQQMQLEMLDVQARAIVEQVEKADASLMDIEAVKNSLDEVKQIKEGTDILAPVSAGIFLKAKLQKNDELLVNVGNEVVASKSVAETKTLLEEKATEVKETRDMLMDSLQKIEEQLLQFN